MPAPKAKSSHRARELRRQVLLPARMRLGTSWSDASILNISSRGLLVRSGRPAPEGTIIELRRGDHVIVARVMWRQGPRVGLQAEERLPVEEILTVSQSAGLQLTAARPRTVERRKHPRRQHDHSRMRARAIEFIGTAVIGLSLAGGAVAMAVQAFARPLMVVKSALAG
jgi:hypothetical protein